MKNNSNRVQYVLCSVACFLILISSCCYGTQITITSQSYTMDTTAWGSSYINNNYGASTSLDIGANAGAWARPLLKFDLSSIPSGSEIITATLRLYHYSTYTGSGNSLTSVHRMLVDWDEGNLNGQSGVSSGTYRKTGITWNAGSKPDSDGFDALDIPTSTVNVPLQSYGWVEFDVSADVRLMYEHPAENFGWLIKGEESTGSPKIWLAYSSEYSSSRPELVVRYEANSNIEEYTLNSQSNIVDNTTWGLDAINNNYGASTSLDVGATGYYPWARPLLKYDLSSIPSGRDIISATLRLYHYSTYVGTGDSLTSVYRMLVDWDEGNLNGQSGISNGTYRKSGVAWNGGSVPDNDGVDALPSPTSTVSVPLQTYGWVDFDVSADVRYMYEHQSDNYGWLIKGEENTGNPKLWSAISSEYSSYRPELVVKCSPTGYEDQTTLSVDSVWDNTAWGSSYINNNYGASTSLDIGANAGAWARPIIAFGLNGYSGIPAGKSILSSNMWLYHYGTWTGTGSSNTSVYRMLVDWDEGNQNGQSGISNGIYRKSGIAWNGGSVPDSDGVDALSTPTSAVSVPLQTYGWVNFDVLADIWDMYQNPSENYGWLIKGEENTGNPKLWMAYSTESSVSPPQLVVNHRPSPGIKVADGKLSVNNKPFFSVGIHSVGHYHYGLKDAGEKGFNTAITNAFNTNDPNSYLADIKDSYAHGMYGVTALNGLYTDLNLLASVVTLCRKDPGLLVWVLEDEPNIRGISPEQLRPAYELIKKLDPIHPVMLNLSGCDQQDHEDYSSVCDILSNDIYPVPDTPLASVGYYADVAVNASQGKPVWQVLQMGPVKPYLQGDRHPTIDEVRCMTYVSIAHGVSGIMYFAYKVYEYDPYWCVTSEPTYWNQWAGLTSELKTLDPYILAPKTAQQPTVQVDPPYTNHIEWYHGALHISLRETEKELFLIAVNAIDQSITATITLPVAAGSSSAEVMFEGRQETLTNNTTLQDSWAPHAVHLYRVLK